MYMTERGLIALVLVCGVLILQTIGFVYGFNGQLLIITSNVFTAVLAYYFGKTVKQQT